MILLPFGLWSHFGAKNGIREGCQKCAGFKYQILIDSMIFLRKGSGGQKSDPRGVPEMGPALQREQHFEEPRRIGVSKTHENQTPGNPVCKKQIRGGGPAILRAT